MALQALSHGVNAFSLNVTSVLIDSTKDQHENIFVSPFSISILLMMISMGSTPNSRTHRQIMSGLGLDYNTNLHSNFKSLLNSISSNPSVSLDNFGLFDKNKVDESSNVFQDFKSNIENLYSGDIWSVDFRNNGRGIQTRVNDRVKEKTHGQISKTIQEPFDPLTIGLLLNVIHFKGRWEDPFDPEFTSPGDFYSSDGKTNTVPFMTKTARYPISRIKVNNLEATAIRLGYTNQSSMIIVSPNETELKEFVREKETLKKTIESSVKQLYSRETRGTKISLKIPKFTLKKNMVLNHVLISLGITDMFDERSADLKRISEDICISQVSQDTVIKVNEEGTEASAASKADISYRSMPMELIVDKPFLFLIREDRYGTILFIGVVNGIPVN